jgi:hypothetical protein
LCPQSFLNLEDNAFWNVTLLLGIYCILLSGYEYDEAQSTVLAPACVSMFLVATGINGLYVIVIILLTILLQKTNKMHLWQYCFLISARSVATAVAIDLGHPHRVYIILTHDTHQWLRIQFLVLLMMDAESIQNM